jgi:hypothetical protein
MGVLVPILFFCVWHFGAAKGSHLIQQCKLQLWSTVTLVEERTVLYGFVADRVAIFAGSEGSSSGVLGFNGSDEESGAVLDVNELGAPDCTLIGAGWRIPAHR